jgi:hypothetical protein
MAASVDNTAETLARKMGKLKSLIDKLTERVTKLEGDLSPGSFRMFFKRTRQALACKFTRPVHGSEVYDFENQPYTPEMAKALGVSFQHVIVDPLTNACFRIKIKDVIFTAEEFGGDMSDKLFQFDDPRVANQIVDEIRNEYRYYRQVMSKETNTAGDDADGVAPSKRQRNSKKAAAAAADSIDADESSGEKAPRKPTKKTVMFQAFLDANKDEVRNAMVLQPRREASAEPHVPFTLSEKGTTRTITKEARAQFEIGTYVVGSSKTWTLKFYSVSLNAAKFGGAEDDKKLCVFDHPMDAQEAGKKIDTMFKEYEAAHSTPPADEPAA